MEGDFGEILYLYMEQSKTMEQLVIEVNSAGTSEAIRQFVSQFDDASIAVQEEYNEDYCQQTYGMDKAAFENQLNIGLAQSVLGMTKSWDEVKAELYKKIA